MALTTEELEQLGKFIESKAATVFGNLLADAEGKQAAATAANAEASREAIVGKPDVAPDAGPEFYVHLADGSVVTSYDSGSTHMEVDGKPVQVIGRYQIGA